jgi:hypothetical protein
MLIFEKSIFCFLYNVLQLWKIVILQIVFDSEK